MWLEPRRPSGFSNHYSLDQIACGIRVKTGLTQTQDSQCLKHKHRTHSAQSTVSPKELSGVAVSNPEASEYHFH